MKSLYKRAVSVNGELNHKYSNIGSLKTLLTKKIFLPNYMAIIKKYLRNEAVLVYDFKKQNLTIDKSTSF